MNWTWIDIPLLISNSHNNEETEWLHLTCLIEDTSYPSSFHSIPFIFRFALAWLIIPLTQSRRRSIQGWIIVLLSYSNASGGFTLSYLLRPFFHFAYKITAMAPYYHITIPGIPLKFLIHVPPFCFLLSIVNCSSVVGMLIYIFLLLHFYTQTYFTLPFTHLLNTMPRLADEFPCFWSGGRAGYENAIRFEDGPCLRWP